VSPDGGRPDPQQPQPYGQQLYPGQQYPQQPYPGQPYGQQLYPGQQYPQQPYPGQQYPQQPYPGQQYPPAPPQLYAAPRPEPLPVEPKQYHQFYRAPAFRWWKPVVALLTFAVGWFLASLVAVLVALVWDTTVSGVQFDPGNLNLNTPAMFAANNVSLAACIPVAMLVSWLVYRQRPGFLSSITGRFRWGLFGHFLLIVAPLMLAWMAIQSVLSGGLSGLAWGPNSLFLLVTILLTTPLQAAGEEYANRGLIARSVGSWFGNRWVALAAATLVNGVVFTLLHAAAEPWLNAYYFTVAVTFTLLTWRTGGLEAAIVMHIVNNLLGELTLPFSPDDFSHLFDRQAGTAGPEVLIQIGVTLLVGAVLWWRAGRLKLPQVAAPGAAQPTPSQGPVNP
jgi:membrane protease YdiL (CAAX protease family)